MTFRDVLTALALAISSAAFAINWTTFRDRRKQDKRDLFLKLHERLIDPDLQAGRRLLYSLIHSSEDAARLREAGGDDYQKINRSLAMYDVFALYVHQGYISRELALQEWGHAIARGWPAAQHFIDDRDTQNKNWPAWPNLRRFGAEAVDWHDRQVAAVAAAAPCP